MDFKPTIYKKGEMVRLKLHGTETLGIVKEQDGGMVKVHWLVWPKHIYAKHGQFPLHTLVPVAKAR